MKRDTGATGALDTDALEALARDLDALRDELRALASDEDVRHLRKIARWGTLCTAFGYATAWIAPNPISALAMSTGIFARWTIVAHHVLHRGYDRFPATPARFRSGVFATGWRRFIDWVDWMHPEAWRHEHNHLHHYRLGERGDPDQPEHNFAPIRHPRVPTWLRKSFFWLSMFAWKPLYYAPNTWLALHERREQRKQRSSRSAGPRTLFSRRVWSPFSQPGRYLWTRSFAPYVMFHLALCPLPFLCLGPWAYASVLVNRVAAELLTNVHAFAVIVSNHAGDDLYRFDGSIESRGDFYLRQILGSVDYRTGGDVNDFLHGFLNYQIEHHLWPDMSLLQYRRAQPRVREICEKHGVPYVQESVWSRWRKLMRVAVGESSMRTW